ncbi:MAG: DUF3187 family protein [Nevskia sp.]|nr:DUF3187 family protein [Nevskia sp.]
MLRRIAVLVLACCTLPALADDPPPVQMGALARGFALPALGRPQVQGLGALQQRVYVTDVNEYTARANADETILLDGEATQLSYDLRYGFAPRWEADLFVPVLAQGGGILDGVIEGWHHLWGLPNGGRGDAPKNRYLYQYTRDGQMLLNVSQGSVNFGDIRLGTGYRITDKLAARAMLQLPTADASHLSGSGEVGGALWLDGGLPLSGFFRWLTLYGSAGYSVTATGHILHDQQRNGLAFGAAGLGLRFTPNWDAKLQVYFHGAPYKDSSLAALDHVAAPLTVSTSYRFTPHTAVSLGFQEKANIFASPDFGIFLGVVLN